MLNRRYFIISGYPSEFTDHGSDKERRTDFFDKNGIRTIEVFPCKSKTDFIQRHVIGPYLGNGL